MPENLSNLLAYSENHTEPDFIGYGLLRRRAVMFLYGEYSSFKSWLAQDLAISLASGRDWLIYPTSRARVLIINAELSRLDYRIRWLKMITSRKLLGNEAVKSRIAIENSAEVKLDTSFGCNYVMSLVEKYRIEVIILDNLFSLAAGNLVSNVDANILIANCKLLASRTNVAVVWVHHARQGIIDLRSGGNFIQQAYEMFVSSFLTNWADTIVESRKENGHENVITLTPQKHRLSDIHPMGAMFKFNPLKAQFDIYV